MTNTLKQQPGVQPNPFLARCEAYAPPVPETRITLRLDRNEGPPCDASLLDVLRTLDVETVRRYPDTVEVESLLARRFGLDPNRVLLTNGGDDAIERCCRAVLEPGRELLLPVPTFEMIPKRAALCGATITEVEWGAKPFPLDDLLDRAGPATSMIAIVTPNNPTGAVIAPRDIEQIAALNPNTLVLLDLAYVEFASDDPTALALAFPNVVVIRTFSKAYGIAGLRCGYALGSPAIIDWLRRVGNPYALSGPTLNVVKRLLDANLQPDGEYLKRIRTERVELEGFIDERGGRAASSQANFVFARFEDAEAIRVSLAKQGIAVRSFPTTPFLENGLRITCPGSELEFDRLRAALKLSIQEGVSS
ncbi:MAG: histidinol-phosphate transaminase [Planctomycetota bacterium]|nr:histidinol-phosphate transaminase [Planctomycetota bacterium]